ncbi:MULTISPECIES: (d)CMP kinase [unclassified Emticicia]|uniref:(d)CMP kinase n=1 Tax=unclassified Emticicia TaxID=2627301 RepID=UPI000C76E6CA|nr:MULTISPECIES: (d)CMP kinase [unclassified Emticicia]PLK43078.1 (d)CMP kinase [Emticicia sp. TH156]UTA69114.1 (d)CMP kinase [Emticicia sp. 21SJ11W-3]
MQKITIAVDGYSSCGKSTTAKRVAKKLGYTYIDTGAMYRSVTLYFHEHLITLTNDKEVEKALENIHIEFRRNANDGRNETYLNGLNVEDEIRKLYIANQVSEVSAVAAVRHAMVAQQRRMGKKKGVVMDGRDIGTVVFPDAELKIFMTADPLIRANRRQIELSERGDLVDLEDIIENIRKRDLIDTTRKESPLRKADDAIEVDTSFMTLDEQVDVVCLLADEALSKKLKNGSM